MSRTETNVTFVYATVNGNAREATDMLVRDAMRRQYRVRALDCTRADVRELPDMEFVVFVVSTTGQGDVPPSFKPYWTFLRRADLRGDSLQNVQFAVFGLGDSSYAKYNFAAKKLFRRLIQLGATPLVPRGDGDDRAADGFDSALVPWAAELFSKLDAMLPAPPGLVELSPDACPPQRYAVRYARGGGLDTADVHANRLAQCRPSVSVVVTAMQRLTAPAWTQDVRRIVLRGDALLRYATGDVAYVWPAPAIDETRRLLLRLGIEPDTVIAAIEPLNSALTEPLDFPMPCTALQLFSEHFDVLAVPNRFFFALLSHFAADERERERLQLFGSTAGRAMRRLYSDDEQRRTADAFEHFASARVPLERLLELVPVLRPRAFSIASAGAAAPELALTVAVVDKRTPDGRRHRGRCSAWLASLAVGAGVQLHIEPGATAVPPLDAPLLLIGPGTGIALPLALVDERERALRRGDAAVSRASALFFGNRHRDSDHLYPQLANSAALELYAAVFSRDDKEAPVRYVQHAMRQHAALVRSLLLERNAYIVLCGNASKMPDDVRNALLRILENGGERSDRDAEQILLQLEASGRYQTETWS
jgi:sulfite reductase alpha subunit-like flavoprotein